ncbi:metallophosphoesterase [Actinoplanes sp. NPDC023801]|uniref:metallophosphoesterase family protein n=1 Tax=Actinoplanes sp. NPDC023801 TaxID=3154595 RepID=UPI0033FE700E
MITGNTAERGTSAEYVSAHQFLTALRDTLDIENQQIVLVPGSRDVNRGMCDAYVRQCVANDTRPVPPFWEKWQPFSNVMLRRFHGTELAKDQPWALTEHPNQRLVVAGFNTTMAITHLPGEQDGSLGDAQIDWFAEELSTPARRDWLRIGVMHHRPEGDGAITDAGRFTDVVSPYLDLVLHGQPGGPALSRLGRAGVPVLGSDGPGQLIEVRSGHVRVMPDAEPIRLPSRSVRDLIPRPRRPETPTALRLFTDQVAEICRLRNKGADVAPGSGQSRGRVAYLRVSPARNRLDQGPAEQHPIGVCAGRATRDDVDLLWAVRNPSMGPSGPSMSSPVMSTSS